MQIMFSLKNHYCTNAYITAIKGQAVVLTTGLPDDALGHILGGKITLVPKE